MSGPVLVPREAAAGRSAVPRRLPTPSRRLRIGIDADALGHRQTGNERFIANLIPALRAVCDHELVLYVTGRDVARSWSSLPGAAVRVVPSNPVWRLGLALPARAALDRLDVLLVQYTAPPLVRIPVVTVVHDVAFWLFPQFLSRRDRFWMQRTIPPSIRRATGVVTVSRFSRDEISRAFGISPERITVAPDGVDPAFIGPRDDRESEDGPFFLAVGNLQPRKNLSTLIRAFAALVERRPDLPHGLVIVGQDVLATEDRLPETAALLRAGRLRFAGYVPDVELVRLVHRATALAYPSLYEGFGLPPVEAMAAGTPALVGDIPVMREVVGDAALRLPPTDVAAWSDGLERLAVDGRLRADLAARGAERVSAYTWERSAGEVLSALERAAGLRDVRPHAGGGDPGGPADATAIVVNFNSGHRLGPVLDALRPEVARTTVVDNASTDSSLQLAEGRPEVSILRNERNAGFAAAVNRGAAGAETEWLVLVNPDVHLRPGQIRRLLQGVPADVAAVAPLQVDERGRPRSETAGYRPTLARYLVWALVPTRLHRRWGPWLAPPFPSRDVEVEWLSGALLGIRRTAFEAVGGLDERFFLYQEDAVLGERLRAEGHRVMLRAGIHLHHEVAHGDPRRRALSAVQSTRSLALAFGGWRRRAIGLILATGYALRAAAGPRTTREAARSALPACRELIGGRVPAAFPEGTVTGPSS